MIVHQMLLVVALMLCGDEVTLDTIRERLRELEADASTALPVFQCEMTSSWQEGGKTTEWPIRLLEVTPHGIVRKKRSATTPAGLWDEVLGVNQQYAFELQRRSGTNLYLLTDLALGEERVKTEERLKSFAASFRRYAHRLFDNAPPGSLGDLLDAPDLVGSVRADGSHWLLEFELPQHAASATSRWVVRQGRIRLAVDDLRVLEFELATDYWDGGTQRGKVVAIKANRSFRHVSGLPLPSSMSRTHLVDGLDTVHDFEFRYTFSSMDPSDFTLSAFGLPEPYGVEWERPTPWWLYALISAGVLFVVAVIVSFWKRRLAARSAG